MSEPKNQNDWAAGSAPGAEPPWAEAQSLGSGPPLGPPLKIGEIYPTSADRPAAPRHSFAPDAFTAPLRRSRATSALAGAMMPEDAGPAHAARPAPAQLADQGAALAPAPAEKAEIPAPSGRAKTRLLGFQQDSGDAIDPFDLPKANTAPPVQFPTGWLLILDGPGRGACFTLTEGVSPIGRGADQAIKLDYGDLAISRQGHASIAYDDELGQFYLGHGGKLNLVRLNGKPVLSTEILTSGDQIRIGETTLLFIALCGPDFSWSSSAGPEGDDDKPAALP